MNANIDTTEVNEATKAGEAVARIGKAAIAALQAECAFGNELRRVFGKQAADARYDRKRNASTPELARLGKAFEDASNELNNAYEDSRK